MPKEFCYNGDGWHKTESLLVTDSGTFKGFKYIIADLMAHPAAYIEAKTFTADDLDGKVQVHGGFTWDDELPDDIMKKTKFPKFKGKFLGWDYGHGGDYFALPYEVRKLVTDDKALGKKWTFEEVYEDVKNAIFGIYALLL